VITRVAILTPTNLVKDLDDYREEQDTNQNAEGIEHHSSPISRSATLTNQIHNITPAAIRPIEGDVRATNWVKTKAVAARFELPAAKP
jgi:hypothetical protein